MAPRDRLLTEAARFLVALLGTCPGEVEVTVRSAESKDGYVLRGPPPPNAADAPPAPEEIPPGALWLSALEQHLLTCLPAGGWLSAADLAGKMDARKVEMDNQTRGVLNNLVDRGFARVATGKGYQRA